MQGDVQETAEVLQIMVPFVTVQMPYVFDKKASELTEIKLAQFFPYLIKKEVAKRSEGTFESRNLLNDRGRVGKKVKRDLGLKFDQKFEAIDKIYDYFLLALLLKLQTGEVGANIIDYMLNMVFSPVIYWTGAGAVVIDDGQKIHKQRLFWVI